MLAVIILALVLLGALAFFLLNPSGPQVSVQPNPLYKETTYRILGRDEKDISFTVYQTELNEQVLRLRSNSTLPLEEQIGLISKLLDRIKKDRPLASFKTLSIGRLIDAFGKDDTLSKRLIAAARPLSPIPFAKQNNAARDIMNKQMLYPELKELFEKYGIKIKVAAVEKVLVNADGVPYDGMTWFSLFVP